MFEVNNIPIYTDPEEVLRDIRDEVYQQFGREIFSKIKRSGNNIMVCCPIHNEGQERKPSCGITTVAVRDYPAGTVNCFACGYRDSLPGMISKIFGHNGEDFGKRWLLDHYVNGEITERALPQVDISRTIKKPTIQYVSEQELASYRYIHPYMYQRKLTDEVIERYDVGYQANYVVYEDKTTGYKKTDEVITFPVRDINGNCLFVSRRSIAGKTFYLPTNIDKPVYGVYELPKNCNMAVICESVINALTCASYGVPALALFGTGNEKQYEQLNRLPVRSYILGLDPDAAGRKGTYKLIKNIKGRMLSKLLVPEGKDINDLSYEEFMNTPQQPV